MAPASLRSLVVLLSLHIVATGAFADDVRSLGRFRSLFQWSSEQTEYFSVDQARMTEFCGDEDGCTLTLRTTGGGATAAVETIAATRFVMGLNSYFASSSGPTGVDNDASRADILSTGLFYIGVADPDHRLDCILVDDPNGADLGFWVEMFHGSLVPSGVYCQLIIED